MRRNRPFGAAERENGWAFAQPDPVRKRHRKNWPGNGTDLVEALAGEVDGHDAVGFGPYRMDPQAVSSVEHERTTDAPRRDGGEHGDVERDPPHARERGRLLKSVPTASWCANDERDGEIGVEVHRVPRLA